MRVSIKWKIFALVALLIAGALATIIFRTSQIFHQDKEAFVKELTAKLSGSLAKNVANRISTLQDKLVIFISSKESLARTGAKQEDQTQVLFSRYQDFNSIAFLTPGENEPFKVDWVLRNPQGPAVQWPTDFEKGFLTKFNIQGAANNNRALWRAKAPDGSWLMVLGFGVQIVDVKKAKARAALKADPNAPTPEEDLITAWIMGILPQSAFDEMLGDFTTGLNTGFIVDHEGVAITHSDARSRWTNFSTHPIVVEIMKNNRPASAGNFSDLEGRQVIGSFEWIPKINLAVAVTTPREKAFEAAEVLFNNIIYIGGIILLVATGTAILLANYMTGPLQKLAAIAAEIGSGNFKVPVDVVSNDEIGDLASSFAKMEQGLSERDDALNSAHQALVQSEKMSAFGQLSAGIAHEVKNPLAGILGHAQLAMGKAPSDDLKKHLEVIEKETRRCKTIVENLMKFARAEKTEMKPTDLGAVVQDTINLVDHQLSLAGCKILKDIKPCPMVMANANHLQQVLLNLMVNASHAMETCPTKNVTARVVQVGDKAQIQIEDTGTGIPPEVQKKIFEPFFTTKPAGKGTGLGLSVSIGIVKDHKGEIYLKSEMGKGTTFFIDIPIGDKAVAPDPKHVENTVSKPAVPTPISMVEVPSPKAEPAKVAAHDLPPVPVSSQPSISKTNIESLPPVPTAPVTQAAPAPQAVTAIEKTVIEESIKIEAAPPVQKTGTDAAVPEAGTAIHTGITSTGEYKVKIKRPKLKV